MPSELLERLAALTPTERSKFVYGLTRAERRELEAELAAETGTRPPTGDNIDALGWRAWNQAMIPTWITADYSAYHQRFWEWTDTVTADNHPKPFLAFWPRGFAKSSSVETAVVKLLATRRRRYCLYVSGTADLADTHVASAASICESAEMERHYPEAANPAVNKFGDSKGWRRNRISLGNGAVIDALGLEVAARGRKIEEQRPDLIVLDDIDDEHDSERTIQKKIASITRKILPAGTSNVTVIVAQNLVSPNAIAARRADGRLDMLAEAIQSGPFPAIEGMTLEQDAAGVWRITAGEPAWEGMGIEDCENRIKIYGRAAFILESQQQIDERPGALWTNGMIHDDRLDPGSPDIPEFDRVVLAVDPNQTGKHDDAGLVVVARGRPPGRAFDHAYVIADGTELVGPAGWRDKAAEMFLNHSCGVVVIERTGQGDTVEIFMREAPLLRDRPPQVVGVEAVLSKGDRARPVAELYKDHRVHHVGYHPEVERQQTTWVPGQGESPGGIDALVHGVTHLLLDVDEPPVEAGFGNEWQQLL